MKCKVSDRFKLQKSFVAFAENAAQMRYRACAASYQRFRAFPSARIVNAANESTYFALCIQVFTPASTLQVSRLRLVQYARAFTCRTPVILPKYRALFDALAHVVGDTRYLIVCLAIYY